MSDPRRVGSGAKKGAGKWGSPHAPTVDLLGCDNGVDCDTGGTERRRSWCPNSQTGKNMDGRISGIGAMTLVTVPRDGFSVGGTVLPSFGSPHLFSLGSIRRGQPGGGNEGSAKASEQRSRFAYRARRIVPRAAADLDRPGPLRRRTTAAGSLTGTNRSEGYI